MEDKFSGISRFCHTTNEKDAVELLKLGWRCLKVAPVCKKDQIEVVYIFGWPSDKGEPNEPEASFVSQT